MSQYIALGSTFIPCPKSYNQTRLGLEFQIKWNPYTKRTLITILYDQSVPHPESIGNPCAFLLSHRQPSALAIGMNVSPLLDLVVFGMNPHRQLSCRLVTTPPPADLHLIISRRVPKDTCPKTVSTDSQRK